MADHPFHTTRIGQDFLDKTMPALVKARSAASLSNGASGRGDAFLTECPPRPNAAQPSCSALP
jgi:hypothetical protein